MEIIKYSHEFKNAWDSFVISAKNSHFLFLREYMEYHSDRFIDNSLLLYDNNKLISVLPANLRNEVLYSHQGLTFGGFIVNEKMTTKKMLDVFSATLSYLMRNNIKKIIYKCIPYIYHTEPSEEDRYALFRNKAKLIRRDVSSTINLKHKFKYSKGRKWSINKAKKEVGLFVECTTDYTEFWRLLRQVLNEKHELNPVHTAEEMQRLADIFPSNIKLFVVKNNSELLSGAVIFENKHTVHCQYLANSDIGREICALDFLIDYLIKDYYKDKLYFDFGISNEDEGRFLNTGLISQKEGFGAKAVVHDFYELELI